MGMEQMAQMIAQHRAGVPPMQANQGPVSVLRGSGTHTQGGGTEQGIEHTYQSMRDVGHAIAREAYKSTPEFKRFEALQAQDFFSKMDPQVQKLIASKPEVQKKWKEYEAAAPDLFVDAGEMWGDESMKGYLSFTPFAKPMAELETEKTAADVNKTNIKGAEQRMAQEKEKHPLDVEQLRANVGLTKQQTSASKTGEALTKASTQATIDENTRAQERHPLEMDLLRAHAEAYRMQRDASLTSPTNTDFKGTFDTRKQMDDNLNDLYGKNMISSPQEFATKDLTDTQSMVGSMGYAQLPGLNTPVPAAITEPQAMQWVNASINKAFMAMFQNPAMDPRQADAMYREANALFQRTYGFLRKPEIRSQIPGIDAYIDPDVLAKLAYIQYMAQQDVMTPEQKQKARERLRKNFPLPEMDDPSPGMWKSFSSFFSGSQSGANLEASAIPMSP